MKRALKIAGIVVGIVSLLVVGLFVAAALFVDLDRIVNEQVAKAKPDIEKQLGRKLEIGRVTARVFPTLRARVEGVAVAADPTHKEDNLPLAKIASVGVDIGLLKAVFTLGQIIEIKDVYIDGLSVSVVRYPDGRLSFDDILEQQARSGANKPAETKPDAPTSPDVLQNLSIKSIRVSDARVRLVDYMTGTGAPAESFIHKLNINLKDVRLSQPIGIKMDAAVFSDQTNFEFETSVGPLASDLKGVPNIAGLKLNAKDIDLFRLAPYLGKGTPKIDSARFSANFEIKPLDSAKTNELAGFLGVSGIQFKGGQKFDVRLDTKLKANLATVASSGAQIEKLELAIGQVKIAASGSLTDLGTSPKFKDFVVHSATLSPSALLSYYPEGRVGMPPGLKVDGAATLDVKASGDAQRQTVTLVLDLATMDILLPDQFIKPPGTALALKIDGDFTSSEAMLRVLGLKIDELDLALSGTVKNFEKPVLNLALAAKPFSFDRLVRLIPSANRALASAGAKAQGNGKIEGHVRGTAESIDAALDLALLGCKLDVPGTRVDGDMQLKAKVQGNPSKSLRADLLFDADKAVILVPKQVNKSSSTPLLLQASVERQGDRIDVKKFDFRFAELALTASGTMDLKRDAADLKINMPRLDLEKFAKTVTAIPPEKAKKGFIDAKVALKGNPERLETMTLDLNPFNARLGKSDVRGELHVVNLVAPQVQMKIASNLLDLDELSPPAQGQASQQKATNTSSDSKPGGDSKSKPVRVVEVDDPSLKAYKFAGTADLKKIIVRGDEMTNFRGIVKMADGVLRLEDCTFQMFGGTVSAKGTEAVVWKGRMPFKANLTLKGVEVHKVLASKTRYQNALQGKANMETHANGEGFQTAELEEKLLGNLSVELADGKFSKTGLTESVLGDFKILEKIPGIKMDKFKADNSVKNMLANFEIKGGKMSLSKPMTFAIDGNKVALNGAIGIAGGLFLKGEYSLSGAMLDKVTGGKCRSSEDLRIPITIGGRVDSPQFMPDGKALASTLLTRCLKGSAGTALQSIDAKKIQENPVQEGKKATEGAKKALKGLFGR